MKSLLFWKIFLGFCVAQFVLMQAAWVSYALLAEKRSSFEREVAELVAPYRVSAAQLALETGGIDRFRMLSRTWAAQTKAEYRQNDSIGHLVVSREPAPVHPDAVQTQAIDPLGQRWFVTFALPPQEDERIWSLTEFLQFYLSAEWTIPAILCALLFSATLAWYLSQPINRLRDGLRLLARGHLDTRLHQEIGGRRDEISDLARDFDRMAERMKQLIATRDQLLHDVSHELRSPLARLSLAAAMIRKKPEVLPESLDRIGMEIERLDSLVAELLTLARSESDEGDDDYFEMESLVEGVVRDVAFEYQDRGIDVVFRKNSVDASLVRGNGPLVRRAIENIARNAVQHSPRGGQVETDVSADAKGQYALVSVSDDGPGVSEQDLARIFEPFVRLGNSDIVNGLGLGLAIASRIIRSHAGSLSASNRSEGGLCVVIRLPRAKVDATWQT